MKLTFSEECFGDHFIVGLDHPAIDSFEADILAELRPVGVLLRGQNFDESSNINDLIDAFKRHSGREQIIVAADFPLSDAKRTIAPCRDLPSDETFFADYQENCAALVEQLNATGVNLLLGPPADIARGYTQTYIGKRALGTSADDVTERACRIVLELQNRGLITCPGSFPGDGLARITPGHRFPRIDLAEQEVLFGDVKPFSALIDIGARALQLSSLIFTGITMITGT